MLAEAAFRRARPITRTAYVRSIPPVLDATSGDRCPQIAVHIVFILRSRLRHDNWGNHATVQ